MRPDVGGFMVASREAISKMRLRPHGGVAGRLKMLIPLWRDSARLPAFAENFILLMGPKSRRQAGP
jgi:hypothetical protein